MPSIAVLDTFEEVEGYFFKHKDVIAIVVKRGLVQKGKEKLFIEKFKERNWTFRSKANASDNTDIVITRGDCLPSAGDMMRTTHDDPLSRDMIKLVIDLPGSINKAGAGSDEGWETAAHLDLTGTSVCSSLVEGEKVWLLSLPTAANKVAIGTKKPPANQLKVTMTAGSTLFLRPGVIHAVSTSKLSYGVGYDVFYPKLVMEHAACAFVDSAGHLYQSNYGSKLIYGSKAEKTRRNNERKERIDRNTDLKARGLELEQPPARVNLADQAVEQESFVDIRYLNKLMSYACSRLVEYKDDVAILAHEIETKFEIEESFVYKMKIHLSDVNSPIPTFVDVADSLEVFTCLEAILSLLSSVWQLQPNGDYFAKEIVLPNGEPYEIHAQNGLSCAEVRAFHLAMQLKHRPEVASYLVNRYEYGRVFAAHMVGLASGKLPKTYSMNPRRDCNQKVKGSRCHTNQHPVSVTSPTGQPALVTRCGGCKKDYVIIDF